MGHRRESEKGGGGPGEETVSEHRPVGINNPESRGKNNNNMLGHCCCCCTLRMRNILLKFMLHFLATSFLLSSSSSSSATSIFKVDQQEHKEGCEKDGNVFVMHFTFHALRHFSTFSSQKNRKNYKQLMKNKRLNENNSKINMTTRGRDWERREMMVWERRKWAIKGQGGMTCLFCIFGIQCYSLIVWNIKASEHWKKLS